MAFSELEEFVRRELKLREELQKKLEAYERELAAAKGKGDETGGKVTERAAKLEAAEKALEERVAALAGLEEQVR